MPVEEACNVLIDNNISSAPVYDNTETSRTPIVHAKSYVGMFDYGDVIAYILLVLQNMPTPPPGLSDEGIKHDLDNMTFEIKDIVRRAHEGQQVPVKLASGKPTQRFTSPLSLLLRKADLLSFFAFKHKICLKRILFTPLCLKQRFCLLLRNSPMVASRTSFGRSAL